MEAPTASWALPCVICPSGIRCPIRNVWQHLRISAPKNINHDVIDDCFTNFCSVNANKNILASATFTSPNRIESDSELDNINVPGNAINISMAHTNRWEWGFAITMNIDGVYLIQAYFAGQTLALRYCPLPSRNWSDWVVK